MLEGYVAIFVIGINSLLAYLIIWKGWKNIVRRYFFFTILSVILWTAFNFFADYYSFINPQTDLSLIFTRLTLFSSLGISLFFAFLVEVFPKNQIKHFGHNKIIIRVSLFSLLALLLATNQVVNYIELSKEIVNVHYGSFYWLYITIFLGQMILSFLVLGRKYRTALGLEKLQIQYLFIGTFISSFFAVLLNLVLPLVFHNSSSSRYGPYFTVFLVLFTSYSILRHKLLDVRLVVTRSLIYGFLLVGMAMLFVFTAFISAQVLSENSTTRYFITFITAALVVFGLDPLKKFLSEVSDKYFFKASIDYQAVLRKLSESVSYQLDLEPLIRELRKTLREELKLKFVATLLRKSSNGSTEEFIALDDMLQTNGQLHLANTSPLISYLRSHRHPAVLDSLERKIDDTPDAERPSLESSKAEFDRMGASLVSPVYAQDHLIAVLVLGPKLSGDTFSGEDLNLIEVLSPQIGSAIQKANLYEEVKQFSEGLKAKVDAATSELRERNTSLQTLQHITKEITRTLDFNQVVQQIADSVSTELGYLGAILVFLDDDGRTVRARAITQTPMTKKAMDMLPVKFTEYTTDLHDEASISLGHQVLRSGHTMVTANFAQVISPPIPKLLALGIQKVLGMKTMVVVPINSEGKTIGCIEIGLEKTQEQITPQEFETMYAMADELGVVYRNIKLFDRIQATNQQLEVANAHLQQLDQAKSEFVSIASHQLRTPMTGIMGYLSMMTSGDFGKIAPEHQKILVSLLAESQRMIRLINQFLNVSKIEAGKFTYTKKTTQLLDLAKQEVQELLHVAKDKKLELLTEFTDRPLPETLADPDKIQDVMLNLIDNAIKYTASGSITVGLDMKGPDLHFYVRDTGIGITPADAKELFNKFVRGSGIAQIHPDGSGLGLFIAKSIIDSHDGKIWVESAGEGKGSTFQFTLPVIHTDPGKESS